MRTSIALAKADHLLRDCLYRTLSLHPDLEISWVGSSLTSFLDSLDGGMKAPHQLLLGYSLIQNREKEAMQQIQNKLPEVKIILIGSRMEEEIKAKLFRNGVSACICSKDSLLDLLSVIHELKVDGKGHAEDSVKDLPAIPDVKADLREREVEFLQWACTELTYREIAEKMFLSPKTIDGYREILFHKLQVKSRIGLVRFAIKNGMVSL